MPREAVELTRRELSVCELMEGSVRVRGTEMLCVRMAGRPRAIGGGLEHRCYRLYVYML